MASLSRMVSFIRMQELLAGYRDLHAAHVEALDPAPAFGGLGIGDPAGGSHQIDDDLVGDSHDLVLLDLVIREEGRSVVGQRGHGLLDGADVLLSGIDQEIHVLGAADETVEDDGKASHQEVAGAFSVEGLAEV